MAQLLFTEKHPDVRLMPLLNVEVAEEERLIEPPVMERPEPEERPPVAPTLMPPANVEVAVEEELILLSWVSPEMLRLEANVEEAEW